MERIGMAAALGSFAAFAAFIVNVTAGAFFRTRFLSDTGEFLLLTIASALFVGLILARERQVTPADPD